MLAVAGGKGGSGKTTTALGLAGVLAQRRRRPLVVDCDLDAPNLHLRADVPRDPGVDAADPGADAHASERVAGVDVLPAGDAGSDDLRRALDALPDDRSVLLDCPAGASEAAAAPLRAANAACIVATRGREGVEDAVKTAAMSRAMGTPVRAVVVSRATSAPGGLRGVLGVDCVVAAPPADDPLADPQTTAAHSAVVDALQSGESATLRR